MNNIDDDEPLLFQVENLEEYVDDPEPMELGDVNMLQSNPEKPFRFVISAATFGQVMDKLGEDFDE